MKKRIAVLTAALIFMIGLRYSWLAYFGRIQPALATWIIFDVAVSLSWWTYWSSPQHSIRGNVQNAADFFQVWGITIAVLAGGHASCRWFTPIELVCLVATGVIVVFWWRTRHSARANEMLQVVMTIAYVPTLVSLWQAQRNPESLLTWSLTWISSGLALAVAYHDRDRLGKLYSARSLLLTSMVIALILRLALR